MSASGLRSGLSGDEIEATRGGAEAAGRLGDTERLVVEYAHALTRDPGAVNDALWARLRAAFDDPQLVSLTMVIAFYNMTGRFNRALGIEVEDPLLAPAASCSVAGERTH